jgi:hypothetical protein
MSQKRVQDFGSPVVAKSFKLLTEAITDPSILDGNEFIVDAADRMRINPGKCVTHQGIVIIEDEIRLLNIQNTSIPADYTIYYSHEDADVSGGIAAVLTMDSGLLTSDVVKGCILGYVRYPGGGIPLNQSHFIQPPKLKIGTLIPTRLNTPWLVPIKSKDYMVTSTSGSSLTLTDTWDISGSKPEMYLKVRNNNLTNGTAVLTFPFKLGESPFALLQMVISTDINALITPHFIDSAGSITTLVTTPFTGQSAFLLKSVEIPRTTGQTSNTLVYLQLEITLASAREARVQALGLSAYNLPI